MRLHVIERGHINGYVLSDLRHKTFGIEKTGVPEVWIDDSERAGNVVTQVISAKLDAIDKQGNGPDRDLRTKTDLAGLKCAPLCKQESIDIELQLEK